MELRPLICGILSQNEDLLRALKMWGVSVPPESQPMKKGGWKPTRYGINTPHTING